MTADASPLPASPNPLRDPAVRRRFLQIGAVILGYAGLLFACAGRLDWPAAWAYLALYVAFVAVNAALMLPDRRALIAERARVAPDAERWDLAIAACYSVAGPAVLAVAGLDARLHWSPPVPAGVAIGAGAAMAAGYGLFSWAMAANPFFSAVVRIQTDRGHVVVSRGPYGIVRHPGYLGGLVVTLATPLLLGSWWSLAPTAATVGLLLVRTALEDRTLRRALPGYADYAARVRHRLLPGFW